MTSIEYLINQLIAPCRGIPSHIIETAKEIHKKEIVQAHADGFTEAYMGVPGRDYITGEEYYNEKYESNQGR